MIIMVDLSRNCSYFFVFFFKLKTAYDMRISDWSSDVCSSDLQPPALALGGHEGIEQVAADVGGNAGSIVAGAEFDRQRSEERRVGKECVSTCRSRGSA